MRLISMALLMAVIMGVAFFFQRLGNKNTVNDLSVLPGNILVEKQHPSLPVEKLESSHREHRITVVHGAYATKEHKNRDLVLQQKLPLEQGIKAGSVFTPSKLGDAGSGTAESMLETLLWAAANNNLGHLVELMRLSGQFSVELSASEWGINQLRDSRERYAKKYLADFENVGAVEIAKVQHFGKDNVIVTLKFHHADGAVTTDHAHLRFTPQGWVRDIGWPPIPRYGGPSSGHPK